MANTKAHCGAEFNASTLSTANLDFMYLPALVSTSRSTEGSEKLQMGMAGTFSRMGFGQNGASGTITLTFRKNTANGSETKQSTANTTGWFEDTTHTDTVAKDDTVDFQIGNTATIPGVFGQKIVFDAKPSLVNIVSNPVSSFAGTTGTYFLPIMGGFIPVSTAPPESSIQVKIRAPGTLSYFQLAGRGSNSALTFTIRINGANGNSVVSIPLNGTGVFVDTTHTDTLASGDLVCMTTGALTTQTGGFPHAAFITQSAGTYDWCGYFGTARTAGATNAFFSPVGSDKNGSSSTTTVGYPISYTNTGKGFQNARVNVSANTYTASTTWQFRKNNANANNAVTITNATTGWFEDTTHTDSFVDGDVFDYLWTGGSSGSATVRAYAITIDNGTDAPVAPPWPNFLLNQIAAVGY